MPQSSEKIASFNWDTLIIGRPKTHPRCKRPADPEFAKVRSVHGVCKEEKDKEARSHGLPQERSPTLLHLQNNVGSK
mgnify:CR=1 FL=1